MFHAYFHKVKIRSLHSLTRNEHPFCHERSAAALAVAKALDKPRDVMRHIAELQTMLMDDDATLPGMTRRIPELTCQAVLNGPEGGEALLDGVEREEDGRTHSVSLAPGESLTLQWQTPVRWHELRVIFDSDTGRTRDKSHLNMPNYYTLHREPYHTPETMVCAFHLDVRSEDGRWQEIFRTDCQYQRLFRLRGDFVAVAVRLTVDKVRGTGGSNKIFAFDVQ